MMITHTHRGEIKHARFYGCLIAAFFLCPFFSRRLAVYKIDGNCPKRVKLALCAGVLYLLVYVLVVLISVAYTDFSCKTRAFRNIFGLIVDFRGTT